MQHISAKNANRETLTSQSRAHKGVFGRRITHPLLAALSGHLDSSWHGAVRAGQPDVHGAERDASHRAVQTGALVLAVALERRSAFVHLASDHAGGSLLGCGNARRRSGFGSYINRVAMQRGENCRGSPVQTPMRLLVGAPKSQ